MKRLLQIIIIAAITFPVSVFAVGPKVIEVGRYCLNKNLESDLSEYQFYLSTQADPSGAIPVIVPLASMSADEDGDTTRTCTTRDQTGQPKGQYYVAFAACDSSGNCSGLSVVAPFELTFSTPTGLTVK